MHDEWQSGERHYQSEGSMAQLKPRDSGGVVAIDSGVDADDQPQSPPPREALATIVHAT